MTGRPVSGHVLTCVSCDKTFGDWATTSNAIRTRASAYDDGWRFPPALTEAERTTKDVVEVCPDCVPEWTGMLQARFVERARRGT
jgi:ribosomal protein L31